MNKETSYNVSVSNPLDTFRRFYHEEKFDRTGFHLGP